VRTLGFSSINLSVGKDGEILLRITAPGDPPSDIYMSADELMMLLVEIGNTLENSRFIELQNKTKRILRREREKATKDRLIEDEGTEED
jgi:hypothetical protein